MTELELKLILKKLAKSDGIFCSEADFQFSLAQALKKYYPQSQLWLEYPYDTENNTMYIDIFMKNGKREYYIELKYKTKNAEYRPHKGDVYLPKRTLKNQSAQSVGVSSYRKDIQRLEEIVGNNNKTNRIGYAIFLTNDPLYYNDPIQNRITVYTGCYFRDGVVNKDATLNLNQEYKSTWHNYLDDTPPFKYLIVKIGKENAATKKRHIS